MQREERVQRPKDGKQLDVFEEGKVSKCARRIVSEEKKMV